jgi:tripartite-type tricarboxylate transporter receptor subunit TctC
MNIPRRRFLQLAAGAAALPAATGIAFADTYPARPVHLVAGFAAGSASDINARLLGQWLAERLGQPFIIDNRAGAGGNIVTEFVVRGWRTATPCSMRRRRSPSMRRSTPAS